MTDSRIDASWNDPARIITAVDPALLQHLAAHFASADHTQSWSERFEPGHASLALTGEELLDFGFWLEANNEGEADVCAAAEAVVGALKASGSSLGLLAPELRFLEYPAEASRPIDLHVVATCVWEQIAVRILRTALTYLVPLGAVVRVFCIDALESPAGVLGDHPQLFSAANEPVVVNGIAGGEEIRRVLTAVADAWGVPVLLVSGGQVYARRTPAEMTSSVLLGALRLAKTQDQSAQIDMRIVQRGYEALVRRDEGLGYRPTLTLHHLLADERFIGLPDHHSACADLLEQYGSLADAEELRRLIRHWIRHRIWSINYVPEMVLHDEAHSVAVDRNVASLCEPLLESGDRDGDKPKINVRDVYILGLAAWLHDWGHASANVEGKFPTDPVEVRTYHGPLTALKLDSEPIRHGIRDGKDVNEVALLSAHHQGWTSCDEHDPKTPFKPFPSFSVITKPDEQLRVKSFVNDFEMRCPADSSDPELDLNRMYKRLAILRIADAADIGVHRVPDFATHSGKSEALAKTSLDWAELVLEKRQSVARAKTDDEEILRADIDAFKAVRAAHNNLLGKATKKDSWEESEIDREVDAAIVPHWLRTEEGGRDLSDVGRQFVQFAWNYSTHVIKQVAYYQAHRQIRAVIPTLKADASGKFRLVLHVVVPSPDKDKKVEPSVMTKRLNAIADRVRKDVIREYAVVAKNGPLATSSKQGDRHKAPMRSHLNDLLDIDPLRLEVQLFVPDLELIDPGSEQPVPLLAARTALPFADGLLTSWLQVKANHLVRSTVNAAAGVPAGGQPVACSGDGLFIGSCGEGLVHIFDARTKLLVEEHPLPVGWDHATLLTLHSVPGGFDAVLTKENRTCYLGLTPGAGPDEILDRAPLDPPLVRGLCLSGEMRLIDSEGNMSGVDTEVLAGGAESFRIFDVAAHGSEFVSASAGRDSESIAIWHFSQNRRTGRVQNLHQLPDLPVEEPVHDVLWVHGRAEADCPQLLVVTVSGTAFHDIQVSL